MDILDIGCGDGIRTLEIALNHPKAQVLGIDKFVGLIKGATKLADFLKVSNVTFKATELESLSQGSYEEIYCSFVLQQVKDKRVFISKVAGILTQGGLFYLSFPTEDANYQFPINFRELEQIIEEHGLKIMASKTEAIVDACPYPHTHVVSRLKILKS